MARSPRTFLVVVSAGLALASAGAIAQKGPAPQAPTHKHYEASAAFDQPGPSGEIAPRLQNLGVHTFAVSTTDARAQQFFNQGFNLSYAFNHAEAGRAFREAARLDPNLAMAYWGQALVLGPNINAAMEPGDEPPALTAIKTAIELRPKASERERAYIEALAERYSGDPNDRVARDKAYSAAMKKVHERYPDDLDSAVLYVESVMDLRPWGYWMRDGQPYEGVADAVSVVESVIARAPNHPGALHMYIHLMEAHQPKKAEAAADRLQPLMPAAGHIVHMPAHIYQRVGRYADSIKSNELAIAADEDYIRQCRAQGLYPLGYYPHNLHFLWFSATYDGQSKVAIDAARKTASKVDAETLKQMPITAGFRVLPYYALTRFGKWDEMLREPEPTKENAYLYGTYQYARGLALVAKGQLTEAEQALAIVKQQQADKSMEAPLFSPNLSGQVYAIAPEMLAGEIALARRQYDTAINHLEHAVRLEDGLVYTEPSEWHYPPRHALGAALLEAGRAMEAETVYWEDLKRTPENGWALFGLAQALRAQKKTDDAAIVEARFKKAWARADVTLQASRFAK
jgi:tetratricopeptide (TPR) repeat protein